MSNLNILNLLSNFLGNNNNNNNNNNNTGSDLNAMQSNALNNTNISDYPDVFFTKTQSVNSYQQIPNQPIQNTNTMSSDLFKNLLPFILGRSENGIGNILNGNINLANILSSFSKKQNSQKNKASTMSNKESTIDLSNYIEVE